VCKNSRTQSYTEAGVYLKSSQERLQTGAYIFIRLLSIQEAVGDVLDKAIKPVLLAGQ